ncbi:hypothetical protein BJ508DRAFT_110827 [Ascobolus immersus RN42]|uniref:Uncharacterized protein n=1 Tax=Ascobolus immersus RN42 TaxID=1160509 RepID=A0A3N4H8K0_ASCIM|nr:hypothetical protein BJ508DRAFT_110827 [Ascobolus immersus RN42]
MITTTLLHPSHVVLSDRECPTGTPTIDIIVFLHHYDSTSLRAPHTLIFEECPSDIQTIVPLHHDYYVILYPPPNQPKRHTLQWRISNWYTQTIFLLHHYDITTHPAPHALIFEQRSTGIKPLFPPIMITTKLLHSRPTPHALLFEECPTGTIQLVQSECTGSMEPTRSFLLHPFSFGDAPASCMISRLSL